MKKVPTIDLLNKINDILNDTDNTVDRTIKETFTFKGRKSPDILEKIILAVTEENDVIFDPFLGSGMTIISSQKIKRKLIGVELDNYTYSVDKVLFEKNDLIILNEYFNKICRSIKKSIMQLYETECCGHTNYIKKLLFDPINGKDGFYNPLPNREIKNGDNVVLVDKCPICKKKTKKFSDVDWNKIQEVSKLDISLFPTDSYIVNSRINITSSTGAHKFDAIFTDRNKKALLLIQTEISKLPKSKEKEFLQHVLVASLSLSRIAMYGSSTDILYHVVNEKAQEMNVWELFESKYKNFVKFQKKYKHILTSSFEHGENYYVTLSDYYKFLERNSNLKFDAIITDFPYTDQVPYLERSQMFRVWLNHFDENRNNFHLTEDMLNDEMVVTNANSRSNKNLSNYYKDIDKMFYKFSQHLDDGNPIIIFTKFGKMKYFNVFAKIVDYARKNGFEYTFRVSVEKNDPTLRKQSAYKNTLINEVIIGFEKLNENRRYFYIDDLNYENKIIDDIYRDLKKTRDIPYTLTIAVNKIIIDISRRGVKVDKNIQDRIVRIIEDNFYIDDGQWIQLDKKRLYLDQEDQETLFKKLYELVPIYIDKLLKRKGKFVIEDLYIELIDDLSDGNNQVIYGLLNNDDNIKEIDALVESKTETSGKYYVKKELPKDFNEDAIDIATMDPYEFEDLCKSLLECERFVDVHRKGGSGDLGVDIVAKRFNGNTSETHLFQCKRWVSNVDATPIQRLVSERERLGANMIACFTTSDFSKDAKKVAGIQNVDLVNGTDLLIKLNNHFPGKYYNSNFLK